VRRGSPPRSRNRWVTSCRPIQERYGIALWGRPVSTGFGGGAEPPKDRGWERERAANQKIALPGYVSEDATRCSGAQIERSSWGVVNRIGP
jgi:hypothetical protein